MSTSQFDAVAFFDALERARMARGVTMKQVSKDTGVSETTLSRMRTGRRPDAASLAALSAWAGINPAKYVMSELARCPFDDFKPAREIA
jgi:transcriptional regulator with XRE-family HTH domain